MFSSFVNFTVEAAPRINIYGKKGGSGPTLLLLHGYPQTHHIWHHIADELAETYTVVLIDLRGYGKSSKPAGKEDHSNYSKRIMAQDCIKVIDTVGSNNDKFFVCAHDRGARVAHKLMVDYPHRVKRAILLDIAPTRAMYNQTDFKFAQAYYHWFFLIQKSPLPESLISANSDAFMDAHLGSQESDKFSFNERCMFEYRAMMRDPAAVHATCEDYRASASIDIKENEQDEEAGRKIKCPILVIWGQSGVIEKCFDPVVEWGMVSNSEVSGQLFETGHYIPEEAPGDLLLEINHFLVDEVV